MNDVLGSSECSSGCESGWTLYLEHSSFLSPFPSNGNDCAKGEIFTQENRVPYEEEEEEEEEDLSMVSDASSGPPHLNELDDGDSGGCFYNNASTLAKKTKQINGKKQKKNRENNCRGKGHQEHPSLLDDTASSPLFNFSTNKNFTLRNHQASMENVMDFSQGYSATHFEGRSAFNGHLGHLQQNQWFGGKRRG